MLVVVGGGYTSAEMQLMYSAAPADWTMQNLDPTSQKESSTADMMSSYEDFSPPLYTKFSHNLCENIITMDTSGSVMVSKLD